MVPVTRQSELSKTELHEEQGGEGGKSKPCRLFFLKELQIICIRETCRSLSCFTFKLAAGIWTQTIFLYIVLEYSSCLQLPGRMVTHCLWMWYSIPCSDTCTNCCPLARFPSDNVKDATGLFNRGRIKLIQTFLFHSYSPLATSQTVMDWSSDPVYTYLSSLEKQAQQRPFRRDVGWKWMVGIRLLCW